MKKSLLFFLILFFVAASHAQNINIILSGTVLRDSTNLPVVHHKVVIYSDSNSAGFNFEAVRYTGEQGFYDCAIHNVPPGVTFTVKTKNCDSSWLIQSFAGDTTQVTRNFTICNTEVPGDCHALYHFQADSANPLHVHFWCVSTPHELITSRVWHFGDGTTGDGQDPWHVYQTPGQYNVCLVIHTSTGCVSEKCDVITVGAPPVNCENWITYTSSGSTFNFEGHTASPYPTSYYWNFGDGATQTGQFVTHTYANSGVYLVSLHTADSTGCEWSRTIEVHVPLTTELYGHAFLGDSLFVDHGIAELIKLNTGNGGSIDTVEINSMGAYVFNDVVAGHYFIRVSLLPSSAYYNLYVPTYHTDAIYWEEADLIELGQPQNPYNTYMQHIGGYASGNGTISGNITSTGKYNNNSTPVSGVSILLMDGSDKVLSYTTTDINGEFSFIEVAMGTYKIYPEIANVNTIPAVVTLSDTLTQVGIHFTLSGSSISGDLEKIPHAGYYVSAIFPNPVFDVANAYVSTPLETKIDVQIFSATGQLVITDHFTLNKGINQVSVPVSGLSKGLYYVRYTTESGRSEVKAMVK